MILLIFLRLLSLNTVKMITPNMPPHKATCKQNKILKGIYWIHY